MVLPSLPYQIILSARHGGVHVATHQNFGPIATTRYPPNRVIPVIINILQMCTATYFLQHALEDTRHITFFARCAWCIDHLYRKIDHHLAIH